MERISITRALVEKKRLNDRISREITKIKPITILVGNSSIPVGYKSIQDYEDKVKSHFQSISDLCDRRCKITQAIALSNATTTIQFDNETLTVAEALERKNYYNTTVSNLIERLRSINASSETQFIKIEVEEKAKADREFETFVGRDKSIQEGEAQATRKIIDSRHEVKYIDPLNLKKTIDEMVQNCNHFLENIDILLTESNSKTMIEI